jgi:phosphoribosylaminoimidazole-succinocarboxamide synthase
VRDVYCCGEKVVIVATNRQSAFDRHLASIPFKGGVLNMTSAWWFDQTKHIVPNHVISCPHASVMIGKKCTVFPIEFVMRGYITGSTSTSLWTHYKQGVRKYCGHVLPDGLEKNQILERNLLTPTTKDAVHDELISAEEIVTSGRMTQEDWDVAARYAHELFAFSQKKAAERGMILVDTKYEFGKDAEGNIVLLDEIQTPDSSRYWIASSYRDRIAAGQEPENVDKEFLRLWFAANCDPYKDETLPDAPAELVNELSRRYIMLYEVITGEKFDFSKALGSLEEVQAAVVHAMQA